MAYHYLVNTRTLERKTIRTETLDRYNHTEGWVSYDTEEERERNAPKPIWAVCVRLRQINGPMSPQAYADGGYLSAREWQKAESEEAARALLPPKIWAIKGLQFVEKWDTPQERESLRYNGWQVFSSKEEAEAALPPWGYAVRPYTSANRILLSQAEAFRARGFHIVETHDQAEAYRALPPVYKLNYDSAKYRRGDRNATEMVSTYYRQTKGWMRSVALGHLSTSICDGDLYIDTRENLQALWGRFRVHRMGYSYEYNYRDGTDAALAEAARAFVAKLTRYCEAYRAKHSDEVEDEDEGFNGLCVCEVCGKHPVVKQSARRLHDGRYACDACSTDLCRCQQCGLYFPREEGQAHEDDGSWYCNAHLPPPREAEAGTLLGYTADVTRRRPCFLTGANERKPSLWLGWELECHASPEIDFADCIERVRELFGDHCIQKRDGSLRDRGLEIVSVPASLQWHREHTAKFLQDVKPHLEGWKHPDCGIHIHVGKAQLSPLTQARLLTFVHDPDNQAFITALAGREPNTYAVRGRAKKKLPYYRQEAGEGRYQALNFATRKSATVEFRIFRSNTSPAGFMKNLCFVHALCSWCAVAGNQEVSAVQVGIQGRGPAPGYKNFLAWCERNRGEYPVLVKWCEENAYLTGRASASPSAAA